MNGAYISYVVKDGIPYYRYVVPLDYKPGTIDIWGIKLCETVFDYLENKHILSVYDKIHYQAIDDNDWRIRSRKIPRARYSGEFNLELRENVPLNQG